ncbi:MAG: tripartite tricarboxylate transporter substrate binding protein [Burkholderiales bacterium]|nr:tripartite tricarboxylate transporter substrate binding protein [Burkholderiales bacterium]
MIRVMQLIATALALAAMPPAPQAATGYPNQPIRFVVATAPGGGLDTFARVLAAELTARAGQQVVAENRAGAGTTIGTAAVARAKPDGYTLLVTTAAFAIGPAIYRRIPYDPLRDFAPVTMAAFTPNLMTVHPSVPARSVKDLIALARAGAAKGDPILYASGGSGTNGHLATALFLSLAGVDMTHVPYKSGSLGVIDLIAGQVAMMTDSMSSLLPHVRSGRLRALGVSSARRAAALPELPTIAESGVPGYESAQWYGLLAPAGTPADILSWLHREATAALRAAKVRDRLAADGLEVAATTPDAFAALIRSDIAKWTKVVKVIGMEPM